MVEPNIPKARPRSGPENRFWMKPETWGEIRPPARPWTIRAIDSIVGRLGRAGGRAGQGEQRDSDHEDGPPAAGVAEPARRDQEHAESQGIAGDDPLHVAVVGAQSGAQGGQRDVDDAEVEQGHRAGDQADGQRPPPSGIRGRRSADAGGRVRRSQSPIFTMDRRPDAGSRGNVTRWISSASSTAQDSQRTYAHALAELRRGARPATGCGSSFPRSPVLDAARWPRRTRSARPRGGAGLPGSSGARAPADRVRRGRGRPHGRSAEQIFGGIDALSCARR